MAIASARSLRRWGGHLTKPASYCCSFLGEMFLLLASLASLGTITGCAGLVSGNTTGSPPSTLIITNVQAPSDTTSTSQIVWTTNVAANSAVNYGTTTSYGSSTSIDSTMVTNHQLTVSSLAAGTTYYYQVSSTDSKGNHGQSGGHTFKTAGFSLSGTISPAAGGNGATLTLSGAASTTTTADSLGNYIFSGLPNGTYTVAPSHAGFTFIPSSQSMTVSGANVTGVNFTDNAAAVAPTITTQPGNQAVTAGQTATFTVVATGTAPLSYQWQKNGVNIAGATSTSYTMPATTTADSGASLAAVVSNTAGTVTSAAATLTVNAAAVAPTIATQPVNQTVTAGQTATFTVVATGSAPLSYQWQKNGVNIAGATSAGYTTPATTTADSGASLAAGVSNTAGTVTSAAATLTVNPAPVAPTITTQPGNQTVTAGQTATFAVVAAGTSPLSYQWRKNGANIAGATAASYTTPATATTDSGSTFAVVASNTAGTATSAAATLMVNPAPAPGIQVSSTSLNFGNGVVGSTLSQVLIITNTGTATLSITQVTETGSAFFTVSGFSLPLNVNAGQQTTITVAFLPTSVGAASGNISIVSNAPGSPLAISLSGTSVAPTFLVGANPTSLNFGNVNVGSTSSLSVMLTNNGNSNVTISSVTVTGTGFSASGVATGTILAPNQSITLNVAFAPTAAGSATGSVSVVSNATNSPATVTLAGSGQPATLTTQWISGFYAAGNGVLPIANIPWSKYTHVIHFCATPGASGTLAMAYLTQTEINQIVPAAHAAGKKVIVCIGDAPGGNMLDATSPTNLAAFIANIVSFVNSNGYDGVDFDWEHNVSVTQYENLFSQLRTAFGTSKLILTDTGNWSSLPTVAAASYANIDQINVMCYDMDIGSPFSWHNDALFQNGDTSKMTCDWRVRAFTSLGVPNSKIGLGIPFYGRQSNGCTAPLVSGCSQVGYQPYRSIVTNATWWNGGANVRWDSTYSADYLSVSSTNQFISYNGTASLQATVNWQKAQGFGGFMTFTVDYEYLSGQTGDARYPLSTTLCNDVFGTCP